jgi:transposase
MNATVRSRTPRVKLPDGRVVQIEPDWFSKLSRFTLLFEALVLAMAQQMTFAAVAGLVDESWRRVHAICARDVDLAMVEADLSAVSAVAIDETACRRGHDYLTIAAEAEECKVVFVIEGRDAKTIARFAEQLATHNVRPEQTSVSVDMS